MTKRSWAWVINALLLAISLLTLIPLLWMVSVSFMTAGESSTFPPPLWPSQPTWANYITLFSQAGIGRYLANSVLMTQVQDRFVMPAPTCAQPAVVTA